MTTPAPGWNLNIKQGAPYACSFRFVGAALVWPGAEGCEVFSQVRAMPDSTTVMIDLGANSTMTVDDNDIVVLLSLTGQQTRALTGNGYYDMFLQDVSTTEAHGMWVAGRLLLTPAISRP